MKKTALALAALLLAVALTACSGTGEGNTPKGNAPTTDRAGNTITLPEKAERIVSLNAATTRILYDLGLGDKLVAIDTYSAANLPADMAANLPQLDMMAPDIELLSSLKPDILFVSNLSSAGGPDLFAPLREAGSCVAEIPTPNSVAGIFDDVRFVGTACGKAGESEALVASAQAALDEIATLVASSSEVPSVYFEVGPAPNCYSTGAGTYLNELISLAGGRNIFADQDSWIAVTEESIIAAAPDVIFTVADYLPNPEDEIMGRSGWDTVPAVQNGRVVLVDSVDSQQATQHVVDAVAEMFAVLHPEAAMGQAA